MTPHKDMLHFKRFGSAQPPCYGVYYGNLCLGAIEATSPTPYPGRSKARYEVVPVLTNGSYSRRTLGVFNSRNEAAEALLTYQVTTKYWRGRISTENKKWDRAHA